MLNRLGGVLINIINKKVRISNKVIMDYGCGMGYFLQDILSRCNPKEAWGCDTSEEFLKTTRSACKRHKNFGGCILVEKDQEVFSKVKGKFDIVFGFEIIEHLSDEMLKYTIQNMYSLLKPNGYVILTTPNKEALKKSVVVCPDCGCYFHKVQHIRKWDKDKLSKYMGGLGFKTVNAIEVTIRKQDTFAQKLISAMDFLLRPVLGRAPSNLIYIGRK